LGRYSRIGRTKTLSQMFTLLVPDGSVAVEMKGYVTHG
jgi:hypothetical protein